MLGELGPLSRFTNGTRSIGDGRRFLLSFSFRQMHRYREISFTCAFRASLVFCPALSDRHETRSSSGSPLLFALYSSTLPALTLGEFFTVQLVAGRVRVGRILSPGIREQPAGFAQSRVSSLVSSAFEDALFSATKTSDRYSFLPQSIRCHRLQRYRDARTFSFHNFIENAQLDTLIVWRKFQFCINLVASRKSLSA